jgi:hypothetical protein
VAEATGNIGSEAFLPHATDACVGKMHAFSRDFRNMSLIIRKVPLTVRNIYADQLA